MIISRRQFLKYCTVAAGALGLSATDLIKLDKALALENGVPILWLNAATCSGCSTSLLNSVYYATIQEILLSGAQYETLSIEYHPTVMAAEGDAAVANANAMAAYILVVEGSVQVGTPYSSNGSTSLSGVAGDYCHVGALSGGPRLMNVVDTLAKSPKCVAVLTVGTCAAYGGIPAGDPNPTQAKGVLDYFDWKYPGLTYPTSGDNFYSTTYRGVRGKTINIPGCPPNPNWIIGTIAYIMAHLDLSNPFGNIAAALPPVDALLRPRMYYGERICNTCNRFTGTATDTLTYVGLAGNFINNNKPDDIGAPGAKRTYCLKYIGCKGSRTKSDCSLRKWQSPAYGTTGINWCVGAGAPCQGCTQDGFPDRMSPFHYIR
jgi:hydrogenase small subunit